MAELSPWNKLSGRHRAKVREAVLSISTLCHLCGHEDADTVDHVIAVREWVALGGAADDLENLRPAHGVNGCGHCGRKCNTSKGNRPHQPLVVGSRDW